MSRFGVKRLHKPLWMPGCENSICPAFVAMGWGCQRGESTARNLLLRTNATLGCKAAPTPLVRTQQSCNKDVQGWWLCMRQTASGEKYHQAVVKDIPVTPSLCPKSSWRPLERKPRWLLDAASASHGRRSPSGEALELPGARKHSTGCWGFILFIFFFLFSPSCTPWAGGWVAASAVGMGGEKTPSGLHTCFSSY